MTTSLSLAQPLSTPRLPQALLHAVRKSLLCTLNSLSSGQLRITEPDGHVHVCGAPGTPCHEVRIRDRNVYAYLALGGTTGAGQAWILGLWDAPDVVAVTRLFVRERAALAAMDNGALTWLRAPLYKAMEWRRRNTVEGSRRNIQAHYDLGNDFFRLFLDDSMTYSAGVFANQATTLAQAQFAKYDLICRKLDLGPQDHVLEIGTGWGGLALHAATHFGARVTTTTISDEQYALASQRVEQAGLGDRIQVLKQDYRQLDGQYDKLISIEMIEAVGHAFLPTYFRQIERLLVPHGEALIQAITIQDQYYEQMRRGTDFIREHVFPGGHLPCVREMLRVTAERTQLRLFDLEDFGQDYARTLQHWRRAFVDALPQVRNLGYSEEFCRLWDFYLASCEAGFREATTSVVHAHFTKPACARERHDFG